MGKSKELSQDLRNQIVAKHENGIGYRRISQLLNLLVSSIGGIIRKWKQHHSTINRPRTGAPRKISDQGVRRILRRVAKEPRTTRKELQKDVEAAVYRSVLPRDRFLQHVTPKMSRRRPQLRHPVQMSHRRPQPHRPSQEGPLCQCCQPPLTLQSFLGHLPVPRHDQRLQLPEELPEPGAPSPYAEGPSEA
ncbi:hypothetical protein SKAU_G00136720 [Synaphobranchus kaupii]|uniref:Sleeping Beauty transposase HTH domain-containing protein n=1 Tax=Synaphobranchus kaupii TaxID=118154 RepID=A0A9Q1FRG1_SYNKA|nr:hypothetical protein SKAU_G00136720 [Synaphobranchus kaupii]